MSTNGVSTIGKRIYEGNQSIDPRVSVRADECRKPKETMPRMNESEVLSELMNSREVNARSHDTAEADWSQRASFGFLRRESRREELLGY